MNDFEIPHVPMAIDSHIRYIECLPKRIQDSYKQHVTMIYNEMIKVEQYGNLVNYIRICLPIHEKDGCPELSKEDLDVVYRSVISLYKIRGFNVFQDRTESLYRYVISW